MNAQEMWKQEYRRFKHDLQLGWGSTAYGILDYASSRYSREAALERKLAAAERTIQAQAKRIESLQMTLGADRLKELVTDVIGYEA